MDACINGWADGQTAGLMEQLAFNNCDQMTHA